MNQVFTLIQCQKHKGQQYDNKFNDFNQIIGSPGTFKTGMDVTIFEQYKFKQSSTIFFLQNHK